MNKTEASDSARLSGKMSTVPFTKMQGLGNDFVFVREEDLQPRLRGGGSEPDQYGKLAARVCDRNFGIGADGLIVVRKSKRDDCEIGWYYLNSDGSTAAMCGNGLRCLALWARHHGVVTKTEFSVDTEVGAVPVSVRDSDHITTSLGEPILRSTEIPVGGVLRESVVHERVELAGDQYRVTCVSMGNPHCVIVDGGLSRKEAALRAPSIQSDAFFPEGVNVEFVEVLDRITADVFVWERGCGPTLACATGAAAVLVAGVLEGRLERTAEIRLPGGPLTVSWAADTNRVSIEGPARVSFEGHFDIAEFLSDDFASGASKSP